MWSRKRLDIGWADLLVGVGGACWPADRGAAAARVEGLWPSAGQTLVCLSVRSGFDLLLTVLALPRGSEVLVSAITIPDMVRIIEHHGLAPVPVDLDLRTMAPTVEDWRRAIRPATRAVLVAHLFGGRTEIGPLLELASQHHLFVLEDCAQAFAGVEYQGHPEADVSMFSFGTIKSSTALGGGVLRVRDGQLLGRMRAAHAEYPVQSRMSYLKRLAKCAVLKTLACRPVAAAFVRVCRAVGCDYDQWVNRASRGFPGNSLFVQIRRQPSGPLLAVLERRLRSWDGHKWSEHAEKGRSLVRMLEEAADGTWDDCRFLPKTAVGGDSSRRLCEGTPEIRRQESPPTEKSQPGHVAATLCPGAAVEPHTYWVFPVLVEEPDRLIERLRRAGFDATRGQSLCVVAPPGDRAGERGAGAVDILKRIVFLPFYPELPMDEARRMAETVLETAASTPSLA